MGHRIGLATVSLHVSALLYVGIGIGMPSFFAWLEREDPSMPGGFAGALGMAMGGLCIVLAVGVEVIAWGVSKRKPWAWFAGLCVFGLYLPSLFFPLGALGMWGLLDKGSREAFAIKGI